MDGGIIKSAPRQNPVMQEIIIKNKKLPFSKKNTKRKKTADKNNERLHTSFYPNFLLIIVQIGTLIIAKKK